MSVAPPALIPGRASSGAAAATCRERLPGWTVTAQRGLSRRLPRMQCLGRVRTGCSFRCVAAKWLCLTICSSGPPCQARAPPCFQAWPASPRRAGPPRGKVQPLSASRQVSPVPGACSSSLPGSRGTGRPVLLLHSSCWRTGSFCDVFEGFWSEIRFHANVSEFFCPNCKGFWYLGTWSSQRRGRAG